MGQENQVSSAAITYMCLRKCLPRSSTHRDLALLRAIATKIIPGLPESIRIAILQQTASNDDDDAASSAQLAPHPDKSDRMEMTPLQYILESDTGRNDIQAELNGK